MKKMAKILGVSALFGGCILPPGKPDCEVIVVDTVTVYNNKRVLPEKIFNFCDTTLYLCEKPTDTSSGAIIPIHFSDLKDSLLLSEKDKAHGAYLAEKSSLNLIK